MVTPVDHARQQHEGRGNAQRVLCIYAVYVIEVCALGQCVFSALLATGELVLEIARNHDE